MCHSNFPQSRCLYCKEQRLYLFYLVHTCSMHMSKKQSNNWEQICIWWWSTHPFGKARCAGISQYWLLRLFPPWYPRWKRLSNLSSRIFFQSDISHWIDSFGRESDMPLVVSIDEDSGMYGGMWVNGKNNNKKCSNTMPWKVSLKLSIQSLSIRRAITVCQTLIDQAETPSTEPIVLSRAWRMPSL